MKIPCICLLRTLETRLRKLREEEGTDTEKVTGKELILVQEDEGEDRTEESNAAALEEQPEWVNASLEHGFAPEKLGGGELVGEGAYYEPLEGSSAHHCDGLLVELAKDSPDPGGLLGEQEIELKVKDQRNVDQLELIPQEPTVLEAQEGTGSKAGEEGEEGAELPKEVLRRVKKNNPEMRTPKSKKACQGKEVSSSGKKVKSKKKEKELESQEEEQGVKKMREVMEQWKRRAGGKEHMGGGPLGAVPSQTKPLTQLPYWKGTHQ